MTVSPALPRCMETRKKVLAAGIIALLPVGATSLRAQTVDYGSLESLFGEPVTTSATGSPQRVTDVPVNMQIITADEIRRSGAHDIPGVLRHVVGVDSLQWNSDNSDVGIRGYDQVFSPRVLVLVDGRQVYTDHYGYVPWSAVAVELSAIRQIEVIKGPNAALYGFNAVSGVINIITYDPLHDDVNSASVTTGTQGLAQGSAVKTFKFDGGGVRISAGGRLNNDFSTSVPASAGPLPRIDNDRFALNLNGAYRLSNTAQIGLEVTHADASTNDFDPVYGLSYDRHRMSSIKGLFAAETAFGLFQASAYHNWANQRSINQLNTVIQFKNEVTVAQVQNLFRLGTDHIFRASLEYRHNSSNTTPFAGGSVFYDDYAAGGMWKWTIMPSLSLTNAVRWDNLHLGRTGTAPVGYPFANDDWKRVLAEVSFNSGLVWQATDLDTLRLTAANGDQLPSLANFGAWLLATPFANSGGNPGIDQSDVTNYEIDWDRRLTAIPGKFRAALFYQESEDVIAIGGEIIPGPPAYTLQSNIGNSIARGAELSLDGVFSGNWRWGVNYRFESITDFFIPPAQNGTSYADFQHVTPRHVVKANLGWASSDWEVDTYLSYQTSTRGLAGLPFAAGSFLVPVQSYVSADARIAYRLNDWATFAISGQNLLESPQQQTSGPKVERRVFGTLTINY